MLSNENKGQMCFLCFRVADMPAPRVPSIERPCASCDAPIWVAKKSPTALPKICIRCAGPSASQTHLSGCVRHFHRHAQGSPHGTVIHSRCTDVHHKW